MIYDSITDEELETPIGDLSSERRIVLVHVLGGPYGEAIVERIRARRRLRKEQ